MVLREIHTPVLLSEAIDLLNCRRGGTFLDATIGTGGHSRAMLEAGAGRVIGLDRDPSMLPLAREALAGAGSFDLSVGLASDAGRVMTALGVERLDGALFDAGVHSLHFDDPGRGFSFSSPGPPDMRLDREGQTVTALDLLRDLPEEALVRLFRDNGEPSARAVSRAIKRRLTTGSPPACSELAELVASVHRGRPARRSVHPATNVFQALRTAVNDEIGELRLFLERIPPLMRSGARLCLLTFQSNEDKAAARAMKGWNTSCVCPPGLPICGCGRVRLAGIVRGAFPLRPSAAEVAANPRSRSARLRCVEFL